jgi:hypothetical protein
MPIDKRVLLLAIMALLAKPAFGLELESTSYRLSRINFNNGGSGLSSANYISEIVSVGEGLASAEGLSSKTVDTRGGESYLLTITPAYERIKLIIDLRARTEIFGNSILEELWQQDNDPYFYWSLEAGISPDLIKGFSVSLDTPPDTQIDTTDTSYQFPEDYIVSGKHTFYILPILVDGSADYDNQLEFDFWVDIDEPLVSQLEPTPELLTANNRIPIGCIVYDKDSGFDKTLTSIRINDSSVYFEYDAVSQKLSYVPSAALPEGNNTILLKAYDLAGNSVAKAWDFRVDTQHPTGAISINNGEQVTHSPYVFINIRVEDIISGVKDIYLSNDGVFDVELDHAYPYAPVIYNWLLAEPDVDGRKTVYAKFKDASGNISGTYSAQIEMRRLSPDTRIISWPLSLTESNEAAFKFEASKPNCLFSYKLDNQDWSAWAVSTEASFSGLYEGNHYFSVKAAVDLNGEGQITIDEEDPTPAQWVWTVKSRGMLEKLRRRILFWRR